MKILRFVLLSALLANLNCAPALAQWQVQNHAVPVGRGSGVTGFGRVVPGTAGLPLSSAGPSADPVFQLLPLPAIAPIPAYTFLGNPTGAAAAVLATQMGFLHSKDFGAVGDLSADDTIALQLWLNACANQQRICYLDRGGYKISSALLLNISADYRIMGVNNVDAKIFLNSTVQDGFFINTAGRVVAEQIGFQAIGTQTGGNCINVGTTANAGSKFYDLFMPNCFNGITTTTANTFDVRRADISCLNFCLNFTSSGDTTITESNLSPAPGANTAALNLSGDPGGMRFTNNKINGSNYGYGVRIFVGNSDGDLIFANSSIEGFATAGVSVDRSGTPSFGNFIMNGVQFGAGASGVPDLVFVNPTVSWFKNAAIVGNLFQIAGSGPAVNINAIDNLTFIGNNINGGSGPGVTIGANVQNSVAASNICDTGFSPCINNLSPTTTVGGQALRYNSVSALVQNTTNFVGAANNSGTEALAIAICPKVTKLQNLFAQHTAPASGQTVTSTLRVAGVDTPVTCTSTGPATSCNDTTHSAYCTAGQTYSLKVVTSATTGSLNYSAGAWAQ